MRTDARGGRRATEHDSGNRAAKLNAKKATGGGRALGEGGRTGGDTSEVGRRGGRGAISRTHVGWLRSCLLWDRRLGYARELPLK